MRLGLYKCENAGRSSTESVASLNHTRAVCVVTNRWITMKRTSNVKDERKSSNGSLPQKLKPEYLPLLSEAIYRIINEQWSGTVMALQTGWGGEFFLQKLNLFASEILSFFTHSKGPFYVDELADFLDDFAWDCLKLDLKDESPEQVAKVLIAMHEELLRDDLKSIEKLRNSSSASGAVSGSKEVVYEDYVESSDDDESSTDEETFMEVDEPKPRLGSKVKTMSVDETKSQGTSEGADDGWSLNSREGLVVTKDEGGRILKVAIRRFNATSSEEAELVAAEVELC
ncbi:hypothetical protein IFM89_025160, partial [Coptis chinensis]